MDIVHKIQLLLIPAALFSLIAYAHAGASTAEPSANQLYAASDRQIRLDGQSNFRDIGGYVTSNGQTVKWKQLFRSGRLSNLSDSDVNRLADLELRADVNFLTTGEVQAEGHDRLPLGVKEISLPMEAGNMNDLTDVVNDARKTGDFSAVSPEINPDIHRLLMLEGRDIYAEFLREVANPNNRPLVFHCSHGVHRTGTATALLLGALGVPWETIRQDYLLSNSYRQDEVGLRLEQLKKIYADNTGIPEEEVDTTNMEAFYILQGAYIDASLDQAVSDYGSLQAYTRYGLGITAKEIKTFRAQLLY